MIIKGLLKWDNAGYNAGVSIYKSTLHPRYAITEDVSTGFYGYILSSEGIGVNEQVPVEKGTNDELFYVLFNYIREGFLKLPLTESLESQL